MNKKFTPKEILVPTITLFLIALMATLLLSLVNSVTADRIAAATAAAEAEARQTVFSDADNFVEKDNYYEATDADGNVIGYVFNTASKGYGGDVPVTVGIDVSGTITGIEYTEGDTIAVGIYVKCQGSGNGAWGKIDDAMLNSDNG